MYDRTKLKILIEECVNDAKNVTIYRDLQTEVIRCLFNARIDEAKVEPVVTEPGIVEEVPGGSSGTVDIPNEASPVAKDVESQRVITQEELRENVEETQNDETQS